MSAIESRSATYRPVGKADQSLKTTVDAEVFEAANRRARELGITTAEYLRDLVMVNLFGTEYMLSLYQDHLKVIAQNGANTGTVEGRA